MRVLLEAPILTRSGYGEHSRLVYKVLKDIEGLDIFVNPLNWGNTSWILDAEENIIQDITKYQSYAEISKSNNTNQEYNYQIHVGIPNEFEKKAEYSVCVTAGIETDRVSPAWIVKTHQGINKIIVPSEHAKLGFVQTKYEVSNEKKQTKTVIGCNCPVEVVPYPVKHFEKVALDIDFKTNFNFLTVALLGARKNIENSIKWFVEEFRENEDVGLILKTSRAGSSVIDRKHTKQYITMEVAKLGDRKCKIYLIHGDLTEPELHSLYTHSKVKAYVSSTHGEGYGLPIFEAAYSGLPVIATDWSGHLDFLTGNIRENNKEKEKKLFARVSYDLKEIEEQVVWENILIEGSKWAYPKEASFKSQLQKVYKNYGMYKKWAQTLQKTVLRTHSPDIINNKLKEALGIEPEIPEVIDWMQSQQEIETL